MRIATLFRYLIGDRGAILTIAGSRQALGVGLLFVLSAGFAREYDGQDLLHEPWHLLVPLAASLASSFVLFSVAYGVAVFKGVAVRPFLRRYGSFLGLFWMTAPLAWLYAIPYARFLGAANAMRANLLTLGVVSAWRVALMVRVLMVVLHHSFPAAFCLVLTFADAVALTLLTFLPVRLFDIMAGIRLSEGEIVLREVSQAV